MVLIALGTVAAAVGPLGRLASVRSTALLLYTGSLLAGGRWLSRRLALGRWQGARHRLAGGALTGDRRGRLAFARRPFLRLGLGAAVAGGVLWSNALAYRGVKLAPYAQLQELEQIGEDFAGQGPALMTEYNPYGARHFLRELDAEGASELRAHTVPLKDGTTAEKGEAVDTDELDLSGLF